jgi:hypothetical protein
MIGAGIPLALLVNDNFGALIAVGGIGLLVGLIIYAVTWEDIQDQRYRLHKASQNYESVLLEGF